MSPLHVSVYDHHQGACTEPDDGRRPKHVGATFACILM